MYLFQGFHYDEIEKWGAAFWVFRSSECASSELKISLSVTCIVQNSCPLNEMYLSQGMNYDEIMQPSVDLGAVSCTIADTLVSMGVCVPCPLGQVSFSLTLAQARQGGEVWTLLGRLWCVCREHHLWVQFPRFPHSEIGILAHGRHGWCAAHTGEQSGSHLRADGD